MKAVYAVVDSVKPISSRGVSVIQLEVPIEDHVAVTNLLFGKTAVLVPMELEGAHRYGVQDTDAPTLDMPKQHEKKPIARLLGQWCNTPSFWTWLNDTARPAFPIENQDTAAMIVRDLVGVESRGDIDGDQEATRLFQSLIRHPYMEWMEGQL